MNTPEQESRDILERMGIENAQSMTAGDVVELSNLIASNRQTISQRKIERPESLDSKTHKIKTGHGNMYVTVCMLEGKPIEVFATIGKNGGSIMAKAEVTGRLVSLALQYGVPLVDIVKQLRGIAGSEPMSGPEGLVKSIPDAVGKILKKYIPVLEEKQAPRAVLGEDLIWVKAPTEDETNEC